MDWLIYRIVISERFSDSYTEISQMWDMQELCAAHDLLDSLEDAEQQAREEMAD